MNYLADSAMRHDSRRENTVKLSSQDVGDGAVGVCVDNVEDLHPITDFVLFAP